MYHARTTLSYVSLFFLTIISAFLFIIWVKVAHAITVSVSALVEESTPPEELETTVIFKGIAQPRSTITIKQNNVKIASIKADTKARFNYTIDDISEGRYTFALEVQDIKERKSSTYRVVLNIEEGTTTEVSDIFVSPTIEINSDSLALDEDLIYNGYTAPKTRVSIFIHESNGDRITYETSAKSDGKWSKTIHAAAIGAGKYQTNAEAVTSDNLLSERSKTLVFKITGSSEPPTGICDLVLDSDINCDGKVDLTDFSILLFYWQTTNPANPRADINTDGIVNIVDFSIMLFYWTG